MKTITLKTLSLRMRLEKMAMKKFGNDKRKAMCFLRERAIFHARKADAYFGLPQAKMWQEVYNAFSSAAYAVQYWLEQDENFYNDMDNFPEDDFSNQPNDFDLCS